MDANPYLFQRLATLHGKSPAAIIDFVDEYGQLHWNKPIPDDESVAALVVERLTWYRRYIRTLNRFYERRDDPRLLRSFSDNPVLNLELRLAWAPNSHHPQFRVTPRNLHDAIWLQFFAFAASGRQIRLCEECHLNPVELGGKGKERKFCSQKYSDTHHNRKKKESRK